MTDKEVEIMIGFLMLLAGGYYFFTQMWGKK